MVEEVVRDLFQIDTEPLGQRQIVASFLIKGSERTALIDPGFPASAETVVRGAGSVGVDPEKLDYIILTHSHYDHAGAAGRLAQVSSGARVVAHKRGAFYLNNAARISGGARMVFGVELSGELGESIDVPRERIDPVSDGHSIDLGDKRLTVHGTPGHSGDHISLFEETTGTLFSGDLACLHYPQLGHVLVPAGSPPIYHTRQVVDGLRRLSELDVKRTLTPHFGEPPMDSSSFLAKNIESVIQWRRRIQALFAEGLEFPQVVEKLRSRIIEDSESPVASIPEFLADVWLRVMLRTGLMGYMADILQYASDLRPFSDESVQGRLP